MNYHVITPLARFENIQNLIDMLSQHNIQWHVITDEDSTPPLDFSAYPWISHYICPNKQVQFFERCNYAINWFIDSHTLINEDMYCILNDDDAYEPNFFLKIAAVVDFIDPNIMICSMERGDHIPASAVGCRAHPTSKLWGVPENLRVGSVGIEQIILKGEILSKFRIPLLNDGDGRFIVAIAHEYEIGFLPEATVLFNYFEPGRWDK